MTHNLTKSISADDVKWIVNDQGELGVSIYGQCFFLYKGYSLQYGTDPEDVKDGFVVDTELPSGTMMYRPVGKREFGECCHPISHMKVVDGHIYDCRPSPYTTELLTWIDGLSDGSPEDCVWRPLPAPMNNG